MPPAAKDHLSDVIGLQNDVVHKVFSCPNCKVEVTVSRYQVQGELPIMCARCNMRWQFKGDAVVDLGAEKGFAGFGVFAKGEAAQMAQPVPKDSYLQFVKDGMKWKAAAPAGASTSPGTAQAGLSPAAQAPAAGAAPAAPKPAVPAPADGGPGPAA